jgi:hypothetical protein
MRVPNARIASGMMMGRAWLAGEEVGAFDVGVGYVVEFVVELREDV